MYACRFRNSHTLDELLSIRDVLGLPGASPKAFLDTCKKALVAALVRFKRDSELYEVAAILGERHAHNLPLSHFSLVPSIAFLSCRKFSGAHSMHHQQACQLLVF